VKRSLVDLIPISLAAIIYHENDLPKATGKELYEMKRHGENIPDYIIIMISYYTMAH
jgi:hypothetical protein